MSPTIPRRSALYVPGSNERAIAKALRLDVDVVILDLEDAVMPAEKVAARTRVMDWLARAETQAASAEIVVRVNGLDTAWGRDDLAALARLAPDAILIPKVSCGADIAHVRAETGPCVGRSGPSALWAMVETPRAVLDPLDIVAAAAGDLPLRTLVLGLNDLARETGTRQVPGRLPMLPWMMSVLAAARLGSLAVLDGVFTDLADPAGFAAECMAARDCGFDGKTIIHPSQVSDCNAAFSPDEGELAAARRIVEAFGAPENAGRGALVVDGRMVEPLHADMAARRLAFAAIIAARHGSRREGNG